MAVDQVSENTGATASWSAARLRLLQQRLHGLKEHEPGQDAVEPRTPGVPVPISAEQHRIWLHAMTYPDVPIYNEPITIHRYGACDVEVLKAAFVTFVERHEAWRTSFSVDSGKLEQIVHARVEIPFSFTDLSTLPATERAAEACRLATEDAQAVLPLHDAPLMRARVLRLAPDHHCLVLVLHHLIFDGVSIYRIMMPELAAIHSALLGERSPLPPPRLQYGDYAVWRQQQLTQGRGAEHLAYWKRTLGGELPVLQLPTDRPRPPRISYRGSTECFALSAGLIARLRALARREGATLYMVLLAGFKTLLFRYSGQQDLLVGGVTDARRRPELEQVVGYFLDTFAVRSFPAADKQFRDYLAEVRESVVCALSASDVPFDRIVQTLGTRRSSSYHPVFQVFFSMEPPVEPFADGWDLTQMDVVVGTSKFDLYLELDERPDAMHARFLYNTDLFDQATVQRIAGHWQVLLEAIAADPARRLEQYPLLTDHELATLDGPGSLNDTVHPFPAATLHTLIAEQGRRTPAVVAVECAGQRYTYAQLLARADVLASHLRAVGVQPGGTVAVLLRRSTDLLAGLIAIHRCGAAYLPLDPATPQARITLCLEDAEPDAVLTEQSLVHQASRKGTCVLLVETCREPVGTPATSVQATPDDIAYVIHTSGTTGRPKGIEITHRNLVNLLWSMQREPGFAAGDRLLAVTTISFDIAALEMFLPLIVGGTVVIAEAETARDPYLLAAAIERSRCTVMQATPSTWRALLTAGWPGRLARPLRVLCGGETLPRELAERLLALGVELWNMYGPTETTIWSMLSRVQPGTGAVPIGRPIDNTTAYILDDTGMPTATGMTGRLYLGGAGLARGYRGLPELTAQRFRQQPAAGGALLYETGDLAVRRADGSIECLGRTDHQVKVRGFRVELEAVEAAVRRHQGVLDAAARVWPDRTGGMRLCVYIVGDGTALAGLRSFLEPDYPEYMIPSDIVPLQALPLTANGKIDRASLPAPQVAKADAVPTEPANDYERRLQAVWAEVLGVPLPGVEEDFFNLGGHSLLVAILQQRVAQAFACRLTMAALYHTPTIRRQAVLVTEALLGEADDPGLLRLQPKGSGPALFWLHPPPEIANLVQEMGEHQPFLGVVLDEPTMESLGSRPTMEELASRHVQTILKAQPAGPYLLAGYCTGGIVAFEVATQLRAAGAQVDAVVLLDAQNPHFYRRVDGLAVELSKFKFYLTNATNKTIQERLIARARKIVKRDLTRTEMNLSDRLIDAAAYRYRPQPYAGTVWLLRAADRPARVDHLPGWQATISGPLHTRDIDGHHEELFAVNKVKSLAMRIGEVMRGGQPSSN